MTLFRPSMNELPEKMPILQTRVKPGARQRGRLPIKMYQSISKGLILLVTLVAMNQAREVDLQLNVRSPGIQENQRQIMMLRSDLQNQQIGKGQQNTKQTKSLIQASKDLEKFNDNLTKKNANIDAKTILALTNNISQLVLDSGESSEPEPRLRNPKEAHRKRSGEAKRGRLEGKAQLSDTSNQTNSSLRRFDNVKNSKLMSENIKNIQDPSQDVPQISQDGDDGEQVDQQVSDSPSIQSSSNPIEPSLDSQIPLQSQSDQLDPSKSARDQPVIPESNPNDRQPGSLDGDRPQIFYRPTSEAPTDYNHGLVTGEHSKHGNSIKVVFNNNPQFIIGRELAQSSTSEHQPVNYNPNQQGGYAEPHPIESNQPARNYNQGIFDEDSSIVNESKRDETRIPTSPDKKHCDDNKPTTPSDSTIDVSPFNVGPFQGQHGKSSNRKTHTTVQMIEQMIKSGFKPPLRMVLTMHKQDGKKLQVPINLNGSIGRKPAEPEHKPSITGRSHAKTNVDHSVRAKDYSVDYEPRKSNPPTSTIDPYKPSKNPSISHDQYSYETDSTTLTPSVKSPYEDEYLPGPKTKIHLKPKTAIKTPQKPISTQAPTHNCKDDQTPQSKDKGYGEQKREDKPQIDQNPPEYASMIDAFQRTYNRYMGIQVPTSDSNDYVGQRQEIQQRKTQDEQDDLMVGMALANMRPQSKEQPRKISMTVITPPKGTTLADAMSHDAVQDRFHDPYRTVAILQSIQSKLSGQDRSSESAGDSLTQNVGSNETDISNPLIEVSLRVPGTQGEDLLPDDDNSADNSDSDGFSSSNRNIEFSGQRRKRSVDTPTRATNSTSPAESYGKQLEPADKLNSSLTDLVVKSRLTKRIGSWFRPFDSDGVDSMLGAASESMISSESDTDLDDEDDANIDDSGSSAAASAPSGSESQDASDEDGDDFGGDESEDSNSSGDSGSDADSDEPFNLGASSERDYNSPVSFEVPQIEINPNTLRQKGCKTVLREVQEIPMDGLGLLRSKGTQSSQLPNGRYRRHIGQEHGDLISSRKVTSIVMTKECHFPDESQKPNPRLQGKATKSNLDRPAQPQKEQKTSQRQSETLNNQKSKIDPTRLDNMNSASSRNQHLSVANSTPKGPINQNHDQPNRSNQSLRPNPSFPSRRSPDPMIEINRYRPPSPETRMPQSRPHYFVPPQRLATIRPPLQPFASHHSLPAGGIKRRSVVTEVNRAPSTSEKKFEAAKTQNQRDRDFYIMADSRRNEIVAKKLYKPPTAEDPYHTLSYSSKNGVDPDMDQDDDDSSIMENDDASGSSLDRSRVREAPTESERRALSDPNHDDTDPVGRQARVSGDAPYRISSNSDGEDADENDGDMNEEGSSLRYATGGQHPEYPRLGKSFKFKHEVQQPSYKSGGLAAQFGHLRPGRQEATKIVGARPEPKNELRVQEQSPWLVSKLGERRSDADDDSADEEDEEEEDRSSQQTQPRISFSRETGDEPDLDPELNPREGQLPKQAKPKKFEKTFAYVHRDLPRKGSQNPEDFVISYGRGAVQTEHEDYDSDRDPSPSSRSSEPERAASATQAVGLRMLSDCSGVQCRQPQRVLQLTKHPENLNHPAQTQTPQQHQHVINNQPLRPMRDPKQSAVRISHTRFG